MHQISDDRSYTVLSIPVFLGRKWYLFLGLACPIKPWALLHWDNFKTSMFSYSTYHNKCIWWYSLLPGIINLSVSAGWIVSDRCCDFWVYPEAVVILLLHNEVGIKEASYNLEALGGWGARHSTGTFICSFFLAVCFCFCFTWHNFIWPIKSKLYCFYISHCGAIHWAWLA